jgi:hypothetical protein
MPRHRLALEAEHYRLPAPPAPTITPGSFQICPTGVTAACSPEQLNGMCEIYKAAFEQACDNVRTTHPADILFALWN